MRCFFHLVNGQESILDDTGVEVPDLDAAEAQAHDAISELRQELGHMAPEDWAGWRLDVICTEGGLLHSIPLINTLH